MAAPKKKSNTMAAFRRGYVKGRTEAREKAVHVVDAIVMDIDARSGLSPMLWCDKEQRNKIINTWVEKAEEVLE
jgi:hypothetical protein